MIIPLAGWHLATLLTIALWIGCTLWPVRSSGGAYDFGGAFDAFVHLFVAVVGTLAIWLAYFGGRVALS